MEDFLTNETNLELANSGKRLANYLIDMLSFYITFFILLLVIGFMFPAIFDIIENIHSLVARLISLFLYGLFMALVEAISKGKSLGKIITGTLAVNEDGTSISFGTGFQRGLVRMIPFYVLTGLGTPCYPWQDHWTKTYVVDAKKSILPS